MLGGKGSRVPQTARRLASKQPSFKESVTAHWSRDSVPTIHRGSSIVPKLWMRRKTRGRRAFLIHRRCSESSTGGLGRDSASISSEKPGENPGRRKSKVS